MATRKLPRGVVRRGRSLVADRTVQAVRISPGMVLFVRARRGVASSTARMANTIGWGSCKCSKTGACKIETTTSPGGDKITFTCKTNTCTGTCEVSGGTVPGAGSAVAAAILGAVLKR
jgi:hypothetical protein